MSLLASCSNKQEADVLSPQRLESILYDYHLAQVMISSLPSSERFKKDLYFDYVYDKHGVTAAEVDSSLVYYARYPKELAEVYERLSVRVERNISRINEEDNMKLLREPVPVAGDSVDLWYDAQLVQMSSSKLSNRFTTTIPYDTNFKSNDSFEWNGEVLFIHPMVDSLSRYLQLAMTVEFANDSLSSVDTLLYASGTFSLALADTLQTRLRNVRCSAFYKGADGDGDVLLYDMQLMRYHEPLLADSVAADSLQLQPDSLKKKEPAATADSPKKQLHPRK